MENLVMTCIKTGADVFITGHNCLVHGDLFEHGDCYILNCGDAWELCANYAEVYPFNLRFYQWEQIGSRVLVARKAKSSEFSIGGWGFSQERFK